MLEERLALAQQLGDKAGMAVALDNLGLVALAQGDFSAARRYQEQCLLIFREPGNKRHLAEALGSVSRAGLTKNQTSRYEVPAAFSATTYVAGTRNGGNWT